VIRISDILAELAGSNTASLPAEVVAQVPILRDAVVTQWEQASGLLWTARTDYQEVISNLGSGHSTTIWLSLRPVSEVTLVEQRDWYRSGPAYVELDEDDYAVDGHTIEKVDGCPWMGHVRVTYTGGYDEDTCPADVRLALLKQVSFLLARNSSEKIALASHASRGGGGSAQYLPADYHPLFKAALIARGRKA